MGFWEQNAPPAPFPDNLNPLTSQNSEKQSFIRQFSGWMLVGRPRLLLPLLQLQRRPVTMPSAKLKPNTEESALQQDNYFGSIEAVPNSVVALDTNYCLINKPAHVRMSGNFSITVEKLMQHWIRGIEIKDLKWIHQLDYATSGVLCVGLNRKAAALASCAFASRTVQKQYLAVLQGHLDITAYPQLDSPVPYVAINDDDDDSGSSLTKRKAPSSGRATPVLATKPKAPPAVEGEVTWQSEVMEANLKVCYEEFMKWKVANADVQGTDRTAANTNTTAPAQPTFNTWKTAHSQQWGLAEKVIDLTLADFRRVPKYRKALRKFLKAVGVDLPMEESSHHARPEIFAEKEKMKEDAANAIETTFAVSTQSVAALRARYLPTRHNNTVKGEISTTDAAGTGSEAPVIFRARRDVPSGCRLVIRVPVAEIPGDFRYVYVKLPRCTALRLRTS
jgi:hypothetical protein